MSKFIDGNKKIEDSVISGYKKVEEGVLLTFGKVRDQCVEVLFAKDSESVEDTKEHLSGDEE